MVTTKSSHMPYDQTTLAMFQHRHQNNDMKGEADPNTGLLVILKYTIRNWMTNDS